MWPVSCQETLENKCFSPTLRLSKQTGSNWMTASSAGHSAAFSNQTRPSNSDKVDSFKTCHDNGTHSGPQTSPDIKQVDGIKTANKLCGEKRAGVQCFRHTDQMLPQFDTRGGKR